MSSPVSATERSSAPVVAIAAAVGLLVLIFAALPLWMVFGGEVFAQAGATLWALCF
jgi:hypothetical protein